MNTETHEQTSTTDVGAVKAGLEKKKTKSQLYAIVKVAVEPDTENAEKGIETRVLTASLYSELAVKLKDSSVVEIVSVIRGRSIPFRQQNVVKFF